MNVAHKVMYIGMWQKKKLFKCYGNDFIIKVLKKAFQWHQDELPTSNINEVRAKNRYAFGLKLCLIKAIENNGKSIFGLWPKQKFL